MTELLSLPEDVLNAVLHGLRDHRDVLRVGATCHTLRKAAASDAVWMRLCSRKGWEEHVDLNQWRNPLNSGVALFRLLLSFSNLLGFWTALNLSPRGGLLYVTWGDLCLIAYRVLAGEAEELLLRRSFYFMGLPDGSSKVQLISTYKDDDAEKREIHLPGTLVWSATSETEAGLEMNGFENTLASNSNKCVQFHLELDELSGMKIMPHGHFVREDKESNTSGALFSVDSVKQQQDTADMRLEIVEQLLQYQFALDHHHLRHNLLFHPHRIENNQRQGYLQGLLTVQHLRCPMPTSNSEEQDGLTHCIVGPLYRKLKVDTRETAKELAGLWSGIYGPHGIEILNVTYTNEEILATKVLGDPNVPCGEVSFRARLSSVTTEVPMEFEGMLNHGFWRQGTRFNVAKVYDGVGRIAQQNFQSPQWITGKLLVSQNSEMGFLWEDYFIIFCHRIELASLHQS